MRDEIMIEFLIVLIIILLVIAILYGIFMLISEFEKSKKQKEINSHQNWVNRGFKFYEWKSEYFIDFTEKNIYRADYGRKWTQRFVNNGTGYFKDIEELKKWVKSNNENLTFYREL